jgi:hypothetical protein
MTISHTVVELLGIAAGIAGQRDLRLARKGDWRTVLRKKSVHRGLPVANAPKIDKVTEFLFLAIQLLPFNSVVWIDPAKNLAQPK